MWGMALCISRQHYNQLLALAEADAPNECCGLFFGRDGQIEEWVPADNVAATPKTHFEIDPAALIAAEKRARGGEIDLLGYFHSHPSGNSQPSQTDAEMAVGDGRYWLIIAEQRILAWIAQEKGSLHGRFTPVGLDSCA
jgi:proteasome lid subunit RPN8/RPN11